jgi:hypothetical protein
MPLSPGRCLRVVMLLIAGVMLTSRPLVAQSFFDTFLKPEYLLPVTEFPAASGGDLNLVYYQVQLPRFTNGEVLVVGEFPRARYFSITAYDDHGAVIAKIDDKDIVPYGAPANPFAVGGPTGAEDILYAATLRLGEGLATGALPQCAPPLPVHANVLDGRSRHTAGTFYSGEQSGFTTTVASFGEVTHVDAASNSGVFLLIRSYLRQAPAPGSQFDLRKPLVWIRSSVNGCAAQLAPAGQYLPPAQWYSLHSILKLDQVYGHVQREIDLGTTAPYGADPLGSSPWFGREEYLPGQAVGRYLSTMLPIDPPTMNAQGRILQMQFRLPALPCRTSIPCALTGNEQLRYWSITFEDAAGRSLATMSEFSLVPDVNGYVTVAMSFGTPLPAHVTSASGYSRIVVPAIPVARLVMRNYLSSESFSCTTENVPIRTAEYHPAGGYMGEYAPVVTFPTAASLPGTAAPLVQPNSCTFP